ncbi:hypothetical protein ACX8XN_19190 [Calditrichota bacterium GD2]
MQLKVADGSHYTWKDWIKYFEYEYPVENVKTWKECIGQITQITDYPSWNFLELLEPASKNYSNQYGPYIQKIKPVQNIGIENLKITRLDDGKPSNEPCVLLQMELDFC